jgi:Ca-activated chloride channel homolog
MRPISIFLALLALPLVGACSTARPGGPTPAERSEKADPAQPPALRPGPGAELAGPIPPPVRAARRTGGVAAPALDLGTDRVAVPVHLPNPPRGGAVRFTFADDRAGWVARIPESQQLPAVAYGDGRIYVSGGFGSVTFYGLDAATGRIDWATTNLEDNGPTAAIYEDGRVLFNTESCTLFALDAATGKRLWHRWLGDPTLAQIATGDGLVFSAYPADGGHRLGAFRVESGARAWSRPIAGELLAAPVVHGDSVFVATLSGWTYRFRLQGGERVWGRNLGATTAPWLDGEELFLSRRRRGVEQQVVVSALTGELLREHHEASGRYLADVPRDLSDWFKVWAFEGSRPIVAGGVRYVAMGGEVTASDAGSGALLWTRRHAEGRGRSIGSVALAGPQVVMSTRGGQIFGLDVDTGYTVWAYDIGDAVVAQPVIARGWVFVGTRDGRVVGLEVGDTTLDGWHMFGGNPQHNGPVRVAALAARVP